MMRRSIRDARRHVHELREDRQWARAGWQVEREIDDALRGGRTVVVGPWLSEVGYEVLYWIPFLRWVMAAFRLDPSRVVAVSRGGVGTWYDGIAAQYVEVWDHVDPEDFADLVVLKPGSEYVGRAVTQGIGDQHHRSLVLLPDIVVPGSRQQREALRVLGAGFHGLGD